MRTFYQHLKVAEDAPPEVIKAAYRALSHQHHPDNNPEDTAALSAMQALNEAYETLMDPELRRAYDAQLRSSGHSASSPLGQDDADEAPDSSGPAMHGPPAAAAAEEADAGEDDEEEGNDDDSAYGPGTSLVPRRDVPSSRSRREQERHLPVPHGGHRRHRSSRALVPHGGSQPLYSSESSRALLRGSRSGELAPMVRSHRAALVQGQPLGDVDREEDEPPPPAEPIRRGTRLWALIFLGFSLLIMGGIAFIVWRSGLYGRFSRWMEGARMAEASRDFSFSTRDVVPMVDPNDKPYARPAQTPHGQPWPTATGLMPGAPVPAESHGPCAIKVDNLLNNCAVHVKLARLPEPQAPATTGTAAAATPAAAAAPAGQVVREAYILSRERLDLTDLPAGTYEVRYRSMDNGVIVRAGTLTLGAAADDSSAVLSLYKVSAGNLQRPQLTEAEF